MKTDETGAFLMNGISEGEDSDGSAVIIKGARTLRPVKFIMRPFSGTTRTSGGSNKVSNLMGPLRGSLQQRTRG